VQLLLSQDADTGLKDKHGKITLDMTKSNDIKKVFKFKLMTLSLLNAFGMCERRQEKTIRLLLLLLKHWLHSSPVQM